MYDDELIGVEDIQEFELELLQRRRQISHSQSDEALEPESCLNSSSQCGRKSEIERLLESAIIVDPDIHFEPSRPTSAPPETTPADAARKPAAGSLPASAREPDADYLPVSTREPASGTLPASSREPDADYLLASTRGPASGASFSAAVSSDRRPDSPTDSPTPLKRLGRYSILSEKLLDERRYSALMKSVDDLQYREQLFREYGIEP